jgi:hypothetical protein
MATNQPTALNPASREELIEALRVSLVWIKGDKWRDGDAVQRLAWKTTHDYLSTVYTNATGDSREHTI